ncbi:DUF4123 domain-containing protein [Burkholderia pseudomultivorans]|uniref:DUF4123 domain-containing protein n=1 Tax=Burkholderia pseudomultivorans TaxID=1207504 RepID=A0ABU2E4C8_9BURK|nr:DUF4123 domain-containing protein [Burkholderia pseudomultivorans]MDR8728064.1 hypothetical protein [Burkholderia pseudomultivorans]MDR8737088.1 hypothetical protein [Burkholderia pseudomultivorans]MDR8740357.1 hypothetical protein [Burkholderia pseudomultivorans]MDR8754559.1 hypothetical protein [Burkholderia pseudomultivorans]MDR8776771.1 hypothetical protein [Burkholderia pseudomultivorans]
MELQTSSPQARLMGLVDGAVCPPKVVPLLERAGVPYLSVFAGLPEEELGHASLFLVAVSDTDADWFMELDRLDLQSPCLSLIWSTVEMDELVTHLQAFLFADIGDNMTAMVRFFDPRNTEAVFGVWGEQVRAMFMGPFQKWMYRGRHQAWQTIQNDSTAPPRICRSVMIRLEQADIDILTAHTEPDEILAALIESADVDGEPPYFNRFEDFIPRYLRAVQWGIREPGDRLVFCQYTYLYGENFDRHPVVNDLLIQRQRSDEPFGLAVAGVPVSVWDEIERTAVRDSGTVSSPVTI